MSTSAFDETEQAWHAARAARGLMDGIVARFKDGMIRRFAPEELSLAWRDNAYVFLVNPRLSYLDEAERSIRVDDYGAVWAFEPSKLWSVDDGSKR